jgi:tetratricopeptide (TPR) repeat protein
MKYSVILTFAAIVCALMWFPLPSGAQPPDKIMGETPPGKMIGAAPVPELLGAQPKIPSPEKGGKPEDAQTTEAAPALQGPITPEDYTLYLKSGHCDPAWDEWIKPGFESFDLGNYATASIFFKNAYEKGCRDPMVLFRLGINQESRGDIKAAAATLAEAATAVAERYPDHPLVKAIHRHAARALYKNDQFKEALPHLLKALQYEPGDFMLLLMAGQVERMEGKKQEALVLFERALAANKPEGMSPDPKLTVIGELIIISCDQKDDAACEKYVNMALEIDPKDKVATKYKGMIEKEKYRKKEIEIIKKITE